MAAARAALDDTVLPDGVIWSRCAPCFADPATPLCDMAHANGGCLQRPKGLPMPIHLTPEQEAASKKAHDEYERINKLSAFGVIETVFQVNEKGAPYKIDPDKELSGDNVGNEVLDKGWFIRIGGSSAISVGIKQPPAAFKRGARIKLSVQLAPEPPPVTAEPELPLPVASPEVAHRDKIGSRADALARQYRGDEAPGELVNEAIVKAGS